MYDWDDEKNAQNKADRQIDFNDAEEVFNGPTLTFEDSRFDYGEPRFITFGLLAGRMIVIAHTPRSDKTRIISMRKGNAREQKKYSQRLEKNRCDEG